MLITLTAQPGEQTPNTHAGHAEQTSKREAVAGSSPSRSYLYPSGDPVRRWSVFTFIFRLFSTRQPAQWAVLISADHVARLMSPVVRARRVIQLDLLMSIGHALYNKMTILVFPGPEGKGIAEIPTVVRKKSGESSRITLSTCFKVNTQQRRFVKKRSRHQLIDWNDETSIRGRGRAVGRL